MISQEINLLSTSEVTLTEEEVFYIETQIKPFASIVQGSIQLKLTDKFNVSELTDQEVYWLRRNNRNLWEEYLNFRLLFKLYKSKKVIAEAPLYLLIEPTSVCNLSCPMCFQSDTTFIQKPYMGMMDFELFKQAVDEAAIIGVKAITLASRGEPTLHPKFCEMLEYLKDKFLDIKVNTNGTKISDKIARTIIECGVNEVVFSIDAAEKEIFEELRLGAKFGEVIANVQKFAKIRGEYQNHKTLMRISGVKVNEKQNWQKFVDFWGPHFDQVGWVPAQKRWDTYNNEKNPITNPCTFLFERIYLWHDGRTNPCDVDYKSLLSPGKFPEKSLKDLWNSGKYAELRKTHLNLLRSEVTPCDRCGVI